MKKGTEPLCHLNVDKASHDIVAEDKSTVVTGNAYQVTEELNSAANITSRRSMWSTLPDELRAGANRNRRNLRLHYGKFKAPAGIMLVSFPKETSMIYTAIPPFAAPFDKPLFRLDKLIAAAKAEVAAAQADIDAASAEIELIEPHPHAHGYTAAGDCTYASIDSDHFLPLAGLLSQPWRPTLSVIETKQRQLRLDYLLKAFPAAMAEMGEALADDGVKALNDPPGYTGQSLPDLFKRKPMLALGMVWRVYGFHRRDRDAWVGAFAYEESLSALIGSNEDIIEEMSLGAALAISVATHRSLLASIGSTELHRRAARRDAERQASWAEVPKSFRERGSWRGWAPSKRQRHLMQRIEAARCLPTEATGRRGQTSDWISRAGGNPRFSPTGKEKS